MNDQTCNIAEAKMHLSRLIERVERGETIVIARNNAPVAVVTPIAKRPEELLAAIDAVRENVRNALHGEHVLAKGETWRDLIDDGRRN